METWSIENTLKSRITLLSFSEGSAKLSWKKNQERCILFTLLTLNFRSYVISMISVLGYRRLSVLSEKLSSVFVLVMQILFWSLLLFAANYARLKITNRLPNLSPSFFNLRRILPTTLIGLIACSKPSLYVNSFYI